MLEEKRSTLLCPAYHHWNMYNCDCCKCLNVDFLLRNDSLWLGKKFIFNFIHDSIISKHNTCRGQKKQPKPVFHLSTTIKDANDSNSTLLPLHTVHMLLHFDLFSFVHSHAMNGYFLGFHQQQKGSAANWVDLWWLSDNNSFATRQPDIRSTLSISKLENSKYSLVRLSNCCQTVLPSENPTSDRPSLFLSNLN